jgi:hypothetical protein
MDEGLANEESAPNEGSSSLADELSRRLTLSDPVRWPGGGVTTPCGLAR